MKSFHTEQTTEPFLISANTDNRGRVTTRCKCWGCFGYRDYAFTELCDSNDLLTLPNSSILLAGSHHDLENFRIARSALSQTVCCSLFVRSFAKFVHLGCALPLTIPTDRDHLCGYKQVPKYRGASWNLCGPLCGPCFLTESLSMGGQLTRGRVPAGFLAPYSQLLLQFLFECTQGSPANVQKTTWN